MKLEDYVVAIPSYKRPETLKTKTLNLLQHYKIEPRRIYIFVADNEQKTIYDKELPRQAYNKLVIGKPGIKNIRNFMPKYFPERKHIFYMDDDIYDVYEAKNKFPITDSRYDKKNNHLVRLPSLHRLIEQGFNLSKKTGLTNWGVYPVLNAYFMKPTSSNINECVNTKLCYIIGFMTGVINNRKAEIRTIDDKEDYERSIKYYLKDDGLLRFNNITAKTKCYKEPGGMQVERTKKRIHDSAVYLTKVYPNLCSLNTSKKSGFTEIRLYDKRDSVPVITLTKSGSVKSKEFKTRIKSKKRTKHKKNKSKRKVR